MDAAIELWQYHNTLLGRQIHEKSARHLKLLEECIERLLAAHGKSLHGYTALRTFFKSHAGELAELVGVVFDTAQSYAGGKGKNSTGAVAAANVQREMIVFECNRIILALFKGALRYRGDNRDAYELDAVHGIEPWTGMLLSSW